jgi:hypothetical protein
MKYNIDYFINKVEALNEEQIIRLTMKGKDGCHCMMGHCGAIHWTHTEESAALTRLLEPKKVDLVAGMEVRCSNMVMHFNDNLPKGYMKSGWLTKLKKIKYAN